jgi:hypothetical protein
VIPVANARGGSGRLSTLKNDGEVAAVMHLPREAKLLPCRRSIHELPIEKISFICSPP